MQRKLVGLHRIFYAICALTGQAAHHIIRLQEISGGVCHKVLCTLFIPAMRDTAERKWASGTLWERSMQRAELPCGALPFVYLTRDRREPPQQRGGFRIFRGARRAPWRLAACAALLLAQGPPDLSLRGGRRPTWQSRGTCRIIGKPSAKSQLPSRDCTPRALPRASRSGRHGPFGASQWHVRRVQRCTSALLPLNCPPQGGHYPQGARRIRKAAKPPTAAQ